MVEKEEEGKRGRGERGGDFGKEKEEDKRRRRRKNVTVEEEKLEPSPASPVLIPTRF